MTSNKTQWDTGDVPFCPTFKWTWERGRYVEISARHTSPAGSVSSLPRFGGYIMTSQKVVEMLLESSRRGVNPAGEDYRYLLLEDTVSLAGRLGLTRRQLEIAALEAGIVPERYQRNLGTIGIAGQIKLLRAQAGVVGAGGLGGFAVELLARCGVGKLTVIDSDSFDSTNLNRQLYALEGGLSLGKAAAAAQRVEKVNGAVEVTAHRCRGDSDNLPRLLQGCALVLDCLDNLQTRFSLEEACRKLKIPLVHGAIAGFMGQVAVIRPGRPLLTAIYGRQNEQGSGRGVETHFGNPSFTPAVVAAWQAAEAVKLLAGMDATLEDTLLLIDLFSGETTRILLTADINGQ